MAKDELISMLVGAGAGYLIGSAGKATGAEPLQCPECISTPLYNAEPPSTRIPGIDDYFSDVTFPGITTIDHWYAGILRASDGAYYMYMITYTPTGFGYVPKDMMVVEFAKLDGLGGIGVSTSIGDIATLSLQGNNVVISSSIGTITTNIDTMDSLIEIDFINDSGIRVALQLRKINTKPVWYNGTGTATVAPGSSMFAFDTVSDIVGAIALGTNTYTVTGMSDLNRWNWNFKLIEILEEEWIVISTPRIKGILYKNGYYLDGTIYIDNNAFKPIFFRTNQTYRADGNISDQIILVYIPQIPIIKFVCKHLGNLSHENAYGIAAYIEGNLFDSGYMWEEHTPTSML